MLTVTEKAAHYHAGEFKIALDSRGELGFLSHAHSDHTSGVRSAKRLLASDATFDLLLARNYAKPGVHEKKFVPPKESGIRLLNAGHILGSSQLHVDNGSTFTYTGDFKLRDSLTNKGAEVVPAETLAIECTYGMPRYSFPDHFQICEQLADWVHGEMQKGRSVVLGGYALGKSQEIVKILNDYLHLAPLVDPSIAKVSEIYNKHGVKLDFVPEHSDEGRRALAHPFVAVYPMQYANRELAGNLSVIHNRKVSVGAATGWALDGRRADVDATFCLSDHADFAELIAYVERAAPKRIVCMFGFNQQFARELKRRGYNAVAAAEAAEASKNALPLAQFQ